MYKYSKRSLAVISTVHEDLQRVAHRAIQICPIDLGIPGTGGKRLPEVQHALFLDGKSKCDGYNKKSYHQTGNALDFYAYVDGKASWKKEHLAIIACAFLQAACELGIELEWGGLWKSFKDYPHVQLKKR